MLNIKPLSVNEAWQGKKYKTDKYDAYIAKLLLLLPKIQIPEGKLKLEIIVAYSNSSADIDNCLKPFIDVLQKKYNFNDKNIYVIHIEKVIVKKGCEYIDFDILPIC